MPSARLSVVFKAKRALNSDPLKYLFVVPSGISSVVLPERAESKRDPNSFPNSESNAGPKTRLNSESKVGPN